MIIGNIIPHGYKGSQVFIAIGRNSRWVDVPVGEGIWLDSESVENWEQVIDLRF
jgi:hypothetical protein